MRRNELCKELREAYSPDHPYGVARASHPSYRNIWFVVPPPLPQKIPKNMPARSIARAIDAIAATPSGKSHDSIDQITSYLFVRKEAVVSSRMEGTFSTIDHVLTPEGDLADLGSEMAQAQKSVVAYAKVLEATFSRALRKRHKVFSVETLCRLHKAFMKFEPNFQGVPGELRTPDTKRSVVWIGGSIRRIEDSIFNPCPPEQVKQKIEEAMRWHRDDLLAEMGDAGMGLALPIRMAMGHAHIEAIHPFPDGNGRVGRMLWPLQMTTSGKLPIYLSGFIEAERSEYGSALQAAQKKLNYGLIVEFICEAIVESSKEANVTKDALKSLPKRWRKRGRFRKNSSADRALDHLLGMPILSIQQLAKALNVSDVAANLAVRKLCECNILRKRTGNPRYRIYAAEEVIALLARDFGENPDQVLKRSQP